MSKKDKQKNKADRKKENFFRKAREKHGDKYNYDQVEYRSFRSAVTIICPHHGPFTQTPDRHLRGGGCPVCGGTARVSEDEFLNRANSLHHGKYSYDLSAYKNTKSIIGITCPEHGLFMQEAKSHLMGHGCPECAGMKPLTTEIFIQRSRAVHGDLYDYSKSEYRGIRKKLTITCPEHGDFQQDPYSHMHGVGCPGCFGTPKKTTAEFVRDARTVHGDRYDYSLAEYDGNKKEVTIVCPEHGPFRQMALSHLRGSGCPRCARHDKYTAETFKEEAVLIHGGKYDYGSIAVLNSLTDVVPIICPEHGVFRQTAISHLQGHGCIECAGQKPLTTEDFILRSREVHGDRYDYSKSVYKSIKGKVTITCPVHGDFSQIAYDHMHGTGCLQCSGKSKMTTDDFIMKARQVHGDRYDYSDVVCDGRRRKVTINCPEHGPFAQSPAKHLSGSGCPCCASSILENTVRKALQEGGISFDEQKRFDWLTSRKEMRLDFYLPEQRIAIECQGQQHFMPVSVFGGDKAYEDTVRRDAVKKRLCEDHGIRILYFSTVLEDYPYEVIDDIGELMAAIMDA